MATVTEKWSGKGRGDQAGQAGVSETGTRVWTVTGVTSEAEALDASPVAAINDPYEVDSTLLCRSRFANRVGGADVYEVTAQYATPDGGTFTTITDPLSAPATYDFKQVTTNEPFDRDIDGNPVTNSAGDPPSQNFGRTYTFLSLRITKNKPNYDYAVLKQYVNRVNSEAVTFTLNGHATTFEAGSIKCVSIEPGRPFTLADKYVPIVATFELWDIDQEEIDASPIDQPHQCRFMDEGNTGWADVDGTPTQGVIVAKADAQAPSFPVRLDGAGKPLDTSRWQIRIGESLYEATSNPSVPAWLDVETGDNAVFLVAKRYRAVDLGPLFALMA